MGNSNPEGSCGDLSVALTSFVQVALLVASSVLLFSWIRFQLKRQQQRNCSGLFSASTKYAIFPVHLKLLAALAVNSVAQGIVIAILNSIPNISESWTRPLTFGAASFLCDSLKGCITFLLLSPGIGHRALRRAGFLGMLMGCVSSAAETWRHQPSSMKPGFQIGEVAGLAWEYVQLIFFSIAWLAPTRFVVRRPAALVWSGFWSVFHILSTTSTILANVETVGSAPCLKFLTVALMMSLMKTWISYHSFALEAKWWHGVEARSFLLPRRCPETSQCFPRSNAETMRNKSTTAHQQQGLQFLFSDLELVQLTDESAKALSNVADTMNNSYQHKEKVKSSTVHSSRHKSRVPLIDFTVMRVLPNRLLGQGSSARVYEGRWGARKVAVKVLYSLEVNSEEIRRTCTEASLLHSLQGESVNIVRLFGVAILPPTLCIVLELCSEGSMGNILYDMTLKPSRTYDFAHQLLWVQQLELALGAARGMSALVAALPGYSHNDIKSANFLVDRPSSSKQASFVVKLADIEFATLGVTPTHIAEGQVTPNWVAPEVLLGTSTVSPASDVYALGMVLFEIATRKIPFENENKEKVRESIIAGRRPDILEIQDYPRAESLIPKASVEVEQRSRGKYANLIAQTWQADPEARLSAADTTKALESMLAEYVEQKDAADIKFRSQYLSQFQATATTDDENRRSSIVCLKRGSVLDP